MFAACGVVSCLLFFSCFLGVYPVLLDFFGCLSIKGPLEILFILKFFLADPSSESLDLFSLVACDVVSRPQRFMFLVAFVDWISKACFWPSRPTTPIDSITGVP